jgi:SAM-dependent methyltransferase
VAPWWEEAFRGDYLRVYAGRDDAAAAAEVAAWRGRLPGLEPGARVLDLACGGGRHLRALRAAGARAFGGDLSPDLLRAAAAGGDRRVARCDMRALPFRDGAFAAVTSFFSSFGYFPRGEEDAAVLAEAARVLAPGGGLLLDLPDPDAVRAGLVPRSEREEGGTRIVEERRLVDGGRRVEKEVLLEEGGRARRWRESLRLYGPGEAEAMAAAAGLASAGRFGGHGTEPWRAGTTARCVLLLRKGAA